MTQLPDIEALIPAHLRQLETYQAGKSIEELAREKGLERISKLASNENPLGPSPLAVRQMTSALWDVHRYPDMYGLKLRQALSQRFNLKLENIILGNGSEGVMAYIARSFIQPGDEILTSEKTFIGFYLLAKAAGAKLVTAPMTSDYRYDVQQIIERITSQTKIIYIANPNNPTGTYINRQEFDHLMEHVPPRVLVVLDEAYFELAQGQGDFPDSMAYRFDHVITTRTFSKAYGLAGVRIGYGFGHPEIIKQLYKAKLPFAPNTIAQAGGFGALEDRHHLGHTLINNQNRYQETVAFLQDQGFFCIESVTNFVSFKTGSAEASQFLFDQLLDCGVIIRPLTSNDMPDFVRVSLGTYEEMQHFFEAMETVLPAFKRRYFKIKDIKT